MIDDKRKYILSTDVRVIETYLDLPDIQVQFYSLFFILADSIDLKFLMKLEQQSLPAWGLGLLRCDAASLW